jgi:hypothetical protein
MNFPYGYGTDEKTIKWIEKRLLTNYHPEYVARLIAWLESRNGQVGVGGGWRADGTQPKKAGFAPAGKSFHQNQRYNDGFIGATAVDLVCRNAGGVHRSPSWAEVPIQGAADAALWGLHCNVGTPGARGSEPWHIQPIEIDGHEGWLKAGSPAPVPNYPFPNRSEEGNEMSAKPAKRWFDTRVFGATLKGGVAFDAKLPAEHAGAKSLYINITVINPTQAGWLVAYGGGDVPATTNVNFTAGAMAQNTALVDVVKDRVQFLLSDNVREAHVIVDIQGGSR